MSIAKVVSFKDMKCGDVKQEDEMSCGTSGNEDEIEVDTLYLTKLQPYNLAFVDGFDHKIGLRYYENKLKESCLVYTMSNVIIVYKLETATLKNIVAHEMKIIDVQIDGNYKIMLSCDIESVFIWDLQNAEQLHPAILRVIHKPFGADVNVLAARLSICGKYLLIASEKVKRAEPNAFSEDDSEVITVTNYILQFWEWSYGADTCDDFVHLPINYGSLQKITFSCNKNEETFFALTFSRLVVFGSVLYYQKKMNLYYPKCTILHKITETLYIANSNLVVSCCKKGTVIIWNDNIICEDDKADDKNYINKCLYEKVIYKILTIGEADINDIKNFSNYLITTDTQGDTKFYDYNFLLLYILKLKENHPISIISVCAGSLTTIQSNIGKWPRDLSKNRNIFRVQNFFLVNATGEAYYCDVQKSNYNKLPFSSSYRVYAESFYTKPWLILCLENGLVQVVNYIDNRVMASFNILDYQPEDIKSVINLCLISEKENYVGVALRNGNLWILDPFTCQPTHKIKIRLKNVITNIAFGPNQLCAAADNKYRLHILKYIDGEWTKIVKFRVHLDRIINIFFLRHDHENYIATVSADRFYNKYIIDDMEDMKIVIQKRIEQAPKITAANIYKPNLLKMDFDHDIIITANDLYKIVLFNAYTADKLYTFAGPVFDSPIIHIQYVPETNDNPDSYFVVGSKKTLGVILQPIDGNPYKHSGVLAHHSYIYRIRVSFDGTYIILFGHGDSGRYYWTVNKKAIIKNYECGGEDLEPFCRLLPGGKNGWLFKEMQDYFYYFQIKANSFDGSEKTIITDYINISEMPDYMRALGFFPSEFEVADLIGEITRTKYIWQQRPREINFTDLVKLYINHKPLDGYNLNDMINAVKVVAVTSARFVVLDTAEIELKLDHLLAILTHSGENISEIQAKKYILDLLKPHGSVSVTKRCEAEYKVDEIVEKFKNLGDLHFSALDFCQRLLGLNATKDPDDDSIMLASDDSINPVLTYPELENKICRVKDESDEDGEIQ